MPIKDKYLAGTETQVLDSIISNRRSLMRLGGTALAGLALAGIAKAQAAVTDTDILNFALNLEYLEAEYYTIATSGMTIDQLGIGITGTGTQGGVTIKNNSAATAIVLSVLRHFNPMHRRPREKNASTSHFFATLLVRPQWHSPRLIY